MQLSPNATYECTWILRCNCQGNIFLTNTQYSSHLQSEYAYSKSFNRP